MQNAIAPDKYSALWISHTSINDFLQCPRAYFLKNVYRSPSTGHKIKIIAPPLALGQTVHEVLESLSYLPTDQRFKESLIIKFDQIWQKVSGKQGGFTNSDQEEKFKKRGTEMLSRVIKHPGPLKRLAVKIKLDLPWFWLSEDDDIILCGKIDWLEFLPNTNSVHIIDFKTNLTDENPQSLQLPIYFLIASNCQKHSVTGASYWYIERQNEPVEKKLPDIDETREKILEIAKQIKIARQLRVFKCPHKTGCFACKPYEAVIAGKAEFVGTNNFGDDIYVLEKVKDEEGESIIL